jgi:signal transduction histidine kinase
VARSLEHAERDLALSRYGIALITAVNIILLVVLGMQHAKRLAATEQERDKLEEESQKLDRMVRERTRQLSDLAAHLQRVTEDEKTRLARELHDELGAILTATKMDLHWLRTRLTANDPAVGEKITRVMSHVDQGIQIKRRLIEDLRPTILLNLGLTEALTQLTEDVGSRNQWHTEVSLPDDMPKLTDDAAIALFRIVQESLTNASKYAHATHVSVALDASEEGVRLRVRDNGRGFPADVERRRMVGHHGLLGMEQRAVALGGKLIIDSMPGGGVTIVVELPPTDAVFNRDDDSASHGSPGPVPASGRGGALV